MRAIALTVLPAVLLLAGCTAATSPASAPTDSPAPSSSSSSAEPTPLATPAAAPTEITRSTFGDGTVEVANASLGSVRQVLIDVRCTGASGTSVHYSFETANGAGIGPVGDTPCNGDGDHVGQALSGPLPSLVEVDLQPGPGVTAAYAILSRDD